MVLDVNPTFAIHCILWFARETHQLFVNLHTLLAQFMQRTKDNAKVCLLEAPPKRHFKEDYGVFRFGQFKSVWNRVGKSNACTLVPTVFRWHKKMEFKFHFYFSFFFGLEKWNSISISIFHFLCTCDIEKRIWISFFVFRFRISLKNGFEFRFSYFVYRLTLKNGFAFRFSFFVLASALKNGFEFRFPLFVSVHVASPPFRSRRLGNQLYRCFGGNTKQ